MTKEHILREIKRVAAETGSAPGKRRFFTETGIKETDWAGKHWLRWGDAVREAGLEAKQWQRPHDVERLIGSYISLIRELGRVPLSRELVLKRIHDSNFPSAKSFRRLGGDKSTLASQVLAYCQVRDGYCDVVQILQPVAATKAPREHFDSRREIDFGFVYLLKSGRFYKIGRSNAAGRRERELSIQLPEKASNVHVIRTDDPRGIEEYWHKRFAEKRRGGEWFELDTNDVAAFRRRKFM